VEISRELVRDLHKEWTQAPVDTREEAQYKLGLFMAMITLGIDPPNDEPCPWCVEPEPVDLWR
jgi:hypothetical protein